MKKLLFTFIAFLALQTVVAQSASEIENRPVRQVQKVKVFPNPASNVVNILGLANSQRASIAIRDAYGNTVLQHSWAIKNNALNIPVTSLEPGFYMVTIRSEEQQIQTKFYKQ